MVESLASFFFFDLAVGNRRSFFHIRQVRLITAFGRSISLKRSGSLEIVEALEVDC